ncbi:MAG TPA: hypothetical protein VLZ89_15715 [Anaerolineales bacterium]|nr:hypothetical protein [Anaerolineales bacterium]
MKPKMDEVFALAFALFTLAALAVIQHAGNFITYYDLQNFLKAGQGDFSHYYYAYWALPFFWAIARAPFPEAFLWIGGLNIAAAWFAVRVFGGRPIPLLVSFHLIYILSQGQIAGILAGGFALLVLGLVFQRWEIAGIGAVIALTKFQVGLVPFCTLWLLWDTAWMNKLRVLLPPAVLFLASLLLYGAWPFQLAGTIISNPPYPEGSVSLWQWIGPLALVLWLPPLVIKLPNHERFSLLLMANALALPYFQQTDLLLMFTLFSGYGAASSNLFFAAGGSGIIPSVSAWVFIRGLVLIPLGIYFTTLYQGARKQRTA